MSIWKNKHLVIATLMAPVMALIAYFGINAIVGEDPHVAEAGESYQLVAKPNCRYSSGECDLKNADFELTLNFERLNGNRVLLKLRSVFVLDGVLVAQAFNKTDEEQPVEMRPVGNDGLNWSVEMKDVDPEHHRLHLVASSGGSLYYGDAAMKFMLAETEEDRKFRN
jgi:hypothetical protein